MSSLTAANGGLQRKVDVADADITEMKVGVWQLVLSVYRGGYTTRIYVHYKTSCICFISKLENLYTHNLVVTVMYVCMTSLAVQECVCNVGRVSSYSRGVVFVFTSYAIDKFTFFHGFLALLSL